MAAASRAEGAVLQSKGSVSEQASGRGCRFARAPGQRWAFGVRSRCDGRVVRVLERRNLSKVLRGPH